jgi:hypothetical protein
MADTNDKKSKKVFLLLRLAVVLGGIIWAAWWLSQDDRWDELVAIFGRLRLWVFLAALLMFAGGQFIVAFRWWLLLRTQSINIFFRAALRLHFLGLFYNNFMPSAVGGDLVRAWYVTMHTEKKFEAVLSVFFDRIVGLLSTFVIAIVFWTLLGSDKQLELAGKEGGPLSWLAANKVYFLSAAGVVALILGAMCIHRRTRAILCKVYTMFFEHGKKFFEKFIKAMAIYLKKPWAMLTVFGLTIFLQLWTITGFWLVGNDLGVGVSVKYYYVFFTLTWVLGAIPVSIGGAVVVEGLLAYMFMHFAGAPAEAAVALALCQRIVWMITSLPGGAIHLFGAHLPEDFSIDEAGARE